MEFVWVVPRNLLFRQAGVHGFLPFSGQPSRERLLASCREEGFFIERRYAETNPEYKQVIPYVACTRGSEILCLQRLATQGEKRLHGRMSIGVGGHINPIDTETGGDLLQAACLRELHEELRIEGSPQPEPIGVLNDDTTEVGAVHFGLVWQLPCETLQVTVRETDAMEGTFRQRDELVELSSHPETPFESWSQLLLEGWPGTTAELLSSH